MRPALVRTYRSGLARPARRFGLFACAIALSGSPLVAQQDTIVSIQVHGNTITPDAEIIHASGLSEGSAFSEELLTQAAVRLEGTQRFERVEVLKRYGSISDPAQIVVVIQVDEGPVRIDRGVLPGQPPRAVKRGAFNVMFVPLLNAEDGYGVTYGAQMAVTGHRSTTTRLVVPMSWGGDKRAAAEFQKEFSRRFAPQVKMGALVQRRTHPFFHQDADRKRVWARAEWRLARPLRTSGTVAWQRSRLLNRRDTTRSIGGDLVVDTRLDPVLPRNAVYARATIERLAFSDRSVVRTELEGNGYIGLYRGTVLALRGLREDMSRPAPPYFKSILGGASNLRGFQAGHSIGDTLVAGSLELRVPLTSPLSMARLGTSVVLDVGTAYDTGQKFRDQKMKKGVGAGVWATAALFRISVMVAHGMGARNRVHFGAGLTF
jgi:outer membrane protein assembly factor BamA